MRKKTGFATLLLIIISLAAFAQNKQEKKLLEFGWDYPNSSFIAHNIHHMQEVPFDGTVFSFDKGIYNAFDSAKLPDATFDYDILSKIEWQKLTDNFLFMRGASYSGAHWLDDNIWNQIIENLKKVSKALVISKAKGVAFDPEYYYKEAKFNPWIYNPAVYNGLSFNQVGQYVEKRGKEFIQALQTYKPDVKILCFWFLGLAYDQSLHKPLSQTGMALYPFFIEGILEGKNNAAEIIDGNESSYGYQNVRSFVEAGEDQRQKGAVFIRDSLQPKLKHVSLAQAIYFDLIYAKKPEYNKGFDNQIKERWLWNNLYNAFKTTDKYVWLYSERIDWWNGKVDPGVVEIINDVTNKLKSEKNHKSNQINGYSQLFNFKKDQTDTYQGFYYDYRKNSNNLYIKLLDTTISSLKIYNNSRLILNYRKVLVDSTINLHNIYYKTGNLIIMATNRKGLVSVAYIN